MKKMIIALILLLPNVVMALPIIKFTLLVVDEQGIAIEGADARIGLMKPRSDAWGGKTSFVSGKTDKDGLFTGQGETQQYATYSANAEGYYGSGIKYNGFTGVTGMLGFRKWQPWNPTLKVVLKKIKNPIPMYAYNTGVLGIIFPDAEGHIGYDLIKHDWVSPHGKGVTADFLFYLKGEFRSMTDKNANLSLKFSNELDGIQSFIVEKNQGSNFISNHHAPLTGYQQDLIQSTVSKPGKLPITSHDDEGNYYFRIRCSDDDESNCLYGKIYGKIDFSVRGGVWFSYYLNPTPADTNIEFDSEKNLLKKLKRKYQVTKP